MKINPTNSNNFLPQIDKSGNKPARTDGFLKTQKNVDTLTIRANESMPDSKFISALKDSIINDVKAGADLHKLDSIKQQIADKEYDINPADIVRKMIGSAE